MQPKQVKQYKICIIVFFNLFFTTINISSMDLFFMRKTPTKKEGAKAFITEFPFMLFKTAHKRYEKCSLVERAKIRNHFAKTNDDLLQNIFRFSTVLHPDLHEKVILALFDGHKENAQRFISSPIKDSYLLYAWARDAIMNRTNIANHFTVRSLSLVWELSDEIKRVENIIDVANSNPLFCVGKKDLDILNKISKNSIHTNTPLLDKLIKMRCHPKYGFNDFKNAAHVSLVITGILWALLIPIVASKKIDQYFCNKTILDKFKIAFPFICTALSGPALDYYLISPEHQEPFLAITASIALATILWLCSYAPFEQFYGGFLGLFVTIPTFVLTMALGFTYGAKTAWRASPIDWKNIDATLDWYKHYFIPEESW